MVASMMLGSIVWPFFSRRYTKRKRLEKDADHYERYQNYIGQLRAQVTELTAQQEEKLRANYPALIQCENRVIGRSLPSGKEASGTAISLNFHSGLGEMNLNAISVIQAKICLKPRRRS